MDDAVEIGGSSRPLSVAERIVLRWRREWRWTRWYWSGYSSTFSNDAWFCPGIFTTRGGRFSSSPCWRCHIRRVLMRAKLIK